MTTPEPADAIRPLTGEEVFDLAGRRFDEDVIALGLEHDGRLRASGLIDPLGTPATPGAPAIEYRTHVPDGSLDRDVAPLVKALLDRLDAHGVEKVLIRWDPMDARGLKLMQGLGFKPIGEMPYFDRGGGSVEYVTGYTDAFGSRVDLARQGEAD